MNQPFTPPAVTGDKLLTSRGPDPDFYGAARSMFCPASTRVSERAAAAERYIGDMLSAALFGGDTDAVRARYADELAEIDERWLHASAMNAQVRA